MLNSRVATALICAALLAGCGDSKGPEATRNVTSADLGRMVLSKRALGPFAKRLEKRTGDSGPTGNRAGADDTVDPRDTARTLARAGRVTGYEWAYAATRRPAPNGVLGMSIEVELFRTEKAASRYLKKQIHDFERFGGRNLEGLKLASVETFDVGDVGDEARGVRAVARFSNKALFDTVVGFRRGRIVGSAAVFLGRELVISSDVERIADALDDRIKRVAARSTVRRNHQRK
jgi:hypothetical protein